LLYERIISVLDDERVTGLIFAVTILEAVFLKRVLTNEKIVLG